MVAVRGVVSGGFGQAGEIGRFGQTYIGGVFAEKVPAGRLNAVIAPAVRDGVKIKFQYLVFGKFFSIFSVKIISFIFRAKVLSAVSRVFLTSCWLMVEPPLA